MSANKPIDVDENGEPRWKYVCKKCLGDKVKSKGTGFYYCPTCYESNKIEMQEAEKRKRLKPKPDSPLDPLDVFYVY